jgi:SAM-dependent methyltransferase
MTFEKDAAYFQRTRSEILPFLPLQAERVLEIGCAAGNTLDFLKKTGRCEWTCGVEVDGEAAKAARNKLDLLLEGNIEHMELPIPPGSIDVVLCLDVLEHLIDPWSTVQKLGGLLRQGGIMLAIIPNVRCLPVVFQLVTGKWDYRHEGILDRTHLRFFTRKTAVRLIESQRLKVETVVATNMLHFGRSKIANWITLSLLKGFLEYEYIIKAVKQGV